LIDQFLDPTAYVVCHGDARNYRNNFVVVACALAREWHRASGSESGHLIGLDLVGTHILRESRIKFGGVLRH
jgi:hypothetical protein